MDLFLNCNAGPHKVRMKSSIDQIFLQPENYQVISIAMGLKNPDIDVDAIKADFSRSIIVKHPKFSSLLVKGKEEWRWRRTRVNIDDHIVVVNRYHNWRAPSNSITTAAAATVSLDSEAMVNAYLAELAVNSPLSMEKPLWEVHILLGLACVVLRVHHAIGDGVSLMSMVSACFGGGGGREEKKAKQKNTGGKKSSDRLGLERGVWGIAEAMLLNAEFEMRRTEKILWLKDDKTVLSGVEGIEHWPRMLATSRFKLDDFKQVKQAVPGATINDVFLGVISSGVSKYLKAKSPKALLKGPHITATVVANLRKHSLLQDISTLVDIESGSSWGNQFGTYLVPIYYSEETNDPLEPVRKMKEVMDRKKQSLEAELSYELFELCSSILGTEIGGRIYKRLLEFTTISISNMVGPSKEIAIAGNPVKYLRVNISSLPQALTFHLVSYAGRADLQISVAKYIIPDVELLTRCFEESLFQMKSFRNSNLKT